MRAAFLDRDGVINRKPPEGDYVKCWDEFEFIPGVPKAIRFLKHHGFRVIVISNQRGVGLGRLLEGDLRTIHDRMREELQRTGAEIDGIYYCPHEYNSCDCRKPQIGMFLEAQREFPDIDFSESFVVGDSLVDMKAAERLGCKKVLLEAPGAKISSELTGTEVQVDFRAPSLIEAVEKYLLNP